MEESKVSLNSPTSPSAFEMMMGPYNLGSVTSGHAVMPASPPAVGGVPFWEEFKVQKDPMEVLPRIEALLQSLEQNLKRHVEVTAELTEMRLARHIEQLSNEVLEGHDQNAAHQASLLQLSKKVLGVVTSSKKDTQVKKSPLGIFGKKSLSDCDPIVPTPLKDGLDEEDEAMPKLKGTVSKRESPAHLHKARASRTAKTAFPGTLFSQDEDNDGRKSWEDDDESFKRRCYRKFQEKVMSPSFDYVMGVIILLNVIFIGIQVDTKVSSYREAPEWINIVETVFTIIFTLELICRAVAYRFAWLLSAWNYFDFAIVLSALLEEMLKYNVGGDTLAVKLSVLRLIRIIKVMRSFRVIRVIRAFRELRVVFISMYKASRSLIWTILLLFLVMYLVAVFVLETLPDPSEAYADTYNGNLRKNYFSSLSAGILTLFQSCTGGIYWRVPSDALEEVIPGVQVIWSLYMAFVLLVLFNTVTGIFVDQSINATWDDQKNVQREHRGKEDLMVKNIHRMAHEADELSIGYIGRAALKKIFSRPEIVAFLKSLDVDPSDVFTFYELVTGGTGMMSLDELDTFVRDCFRLRSVAKNVDVVACNYRLRMLLNVAEGNKRETAKEKSEWAKAGLRACSAESSQSQRRDAVPSCHVQVESSQRLPNVPDHSRNPAFTRSRTHIQDALVDEQ